MNSKRIIISRTDSIGDVVLTLPITGVLKKYFPDSEILFLGKSYTKDLINTCKHVDRFIDWSEIQNLNKTEQITQVEKLNADIIIHVFPVKQIAILAKKAKIPVRIGTTGRLYHYFSCNKLVAFSRKRSELHEAQLNLKLLKPLIGTLNLSLEEIAGYYGLKVREPLSNGNKQLLSQGKFNLIVHPKSKGSAREWGLTNFFRLAELLPRNKFKLFITGTADEGNLIRQSLKNRFPDITDLTGKFNLSELISFINEADGIVAASTGPLHIAAALGKHAIGIYPPIKPMHPGRWAPVGKNAQFLVTDKECSDCRQGGSCECMESIQPQKVKDILLNLLHG